MLTEERRNKQKALKLAGLTLTAGFLLFFYGIPALGQFAAFLSELAKENKPITRKDTTPPAPPQLENIPEFTKEKTLKINGQSEEGAIIKIALNGNPEEIIADAEGKFNKILELKRGENTLTLSAKDPAGNESVKTQTWTITLDNEAPKLTLSSPADGASFFGARQRQVDIKGRVDDSQAKVTVNDRFVIVSDDGSFQFTTTLNEGENKFTVKAEDQAGNSTEAFLTLNFTAE